MMKKKKLWVTALAVFAALSVYLAAEGYRCARQLQEVYYEVPADIREDIRIVQLTDLHGRSCFGEDYCNLVTLIARQKPDLIMMTGDMLDKSDKNADAVCSLIKACAEIAPVYYGYGNHEIAWIQNNEETLEEQLTKAGATVLNVAYCDLVVKGQQLRIGGYHGYYRQPGMFPVTAEQRTAELDFAEEFENTQRYKILLSHIPTAWIDWEYLDKYPADLVLCGHYHGGQIKLPFLGGLYAPYIGLFPKHTEGMYEGSMATVILSAGLGTGPGLPRLNNPAQMVIVDLIAQSQ